MGSGELPSLELRVGSLGAAREGPTPAVVSSRPACDGKRPEATRSGAKGHGGRRGAGGVGARRPGARKRRGRQGRAIWVGGRAGCGKKGGGF